MFKKRLIVILVFFNVILLLLYHQLTYYFQPIAVVVPHHDLVQTKRLEFLKYIAQKRPRTESIILISPDHFSTNQDTVSYSDRTWNLSNGKLSYDDKIGEEITNTLSKNDSLVAADHGIYNILPDIKDVWPEVKVIPIIIGQSIKLTRLNGLISQINSSCNSSCLIIASVDFSHYLPSSLANIHDERSINVLENLETDWVKNLEVDSPQSLYILMNFSLAKKASSWNLYYRSNSGVIVGNRDIETTSHIFGWYQKEIITKKQSLSSSFLVAKNISKNFDLLDERFFFGVDYLNGSLNKEFKPTGKIIIKPQDTSSIKLDNNTLEISLGDDLAVGGYTDSKQTVLIFLPLATINSKHILMTGEQKTEYLNNLFTNINREKVLMLDSYNGRIIL